MELFFGIDSVFLLIIAFGVGFLAGVIKGVVGFGLPTVTISGLGSFASAEVAIAGMILPTLFTNGWQALRQGPRAAWQSIRRFRRFLITGGIVLLLCTQLVPLVPGRLLMFVLGVSVTVFVLMQALGIELRLPVRSQRKSETIFGAIAGVFGGLSGIWGPPTVAMLTTLKTEKAEQVRIQGVVYGLGSIALVVGHWGSGILRAETLPLSLALIAPALLGMAIGFQIQDRIDQATFRKVTLGVLLIGGLNLIRRGVM